jgi:hypothetical protein
VQAGSSLLALGTPQVLLGCARICSQTCHTGRHTPGRRAPWWRNDKRSRKIRLRGSSVTMQTRPSTRDNLVRPGSSVSASNEPRLRFLGFRDRERRGNISMATCLSPWLGDTSRRKGSAAKGAIDPSRGGETRSGSA